MADAFKVLVWEGEQSFLVCVFVWEQEGGKGALHPGYDMMRQTISSLE